MQKWVKFTLQIEINTLPYQVIAPDITGVFTNPPYFNTPPWTQEYQQKEKTNINIQFLHLLKLHNLLTLTHDEPAINSPRESLDHNHKYGPAANPQLSKWSWHRSPPSFYIFHATLLLFPPPLELTSSTLTSHWTLSQRPLRTSSASIWIDHSI